jgi:uncharacterized protein YjbI with pentapeptide repeats
VPAIALKLATASSFILVSPEILLIMDAEELLQRYAAGERDFVGVGLDDVDVSGANLSNINLSRASMNQFFADGANLSGADLSKASIYQAGFNEVNLAGANLSEADLGDCGFRRANLSGANLSGATFRYTRMPDESIRSDSCE